MLEHYPMDSMVTGISNYDILDDALNIILGVKNRIMVRIGYFNELAFGVLKDITFIKYQNCFGLKLFANYFLN